MSADESRPDDDPRGEGHPAADGPASTYAQTVKAKVLADLEGWTRRLISAAEAVNATDDGPMSDDPPPQTPLRL